MSPWHGSTAFNAFTSLKALLSHCAVIWSSINPDWVNSDDQMHIQTFVFFFFFLTGLKISDENDFWTKSILKSRNIQKMTKVQKKVENSILSNAKNGVVDLSTSIYAEMATWRNLVLPNFGRKIWKNAQLDFLTKSVQKGPKWIFPSKSLKFFFWNLFLKVTPYEFFVKIIPSDPWILKNKIFIDVRKCQVNVG